MLRRSRDRVVEAAPVDVIANGVTVRCLSQDLSPGGLFVRSDDLVLPVGARVDLVLHLQQPPLHVVATVAHVLTADEARALGRTCGLGFAFETISDEAREIFDHHVARLTARQTVPPVASNEPMRAVVADGETRLLERLSTVLGRAGFQTVMASNGVEAYAACLAQPPDVIVVALNLPMIDGMQLLKKLGACPELADVPVLVMSNDCGDLRRLQAYQLGVQDFAPKPFTAVELCIRARRLALQYTKRARRVILRGEIPEITLSTLLTVFSHDRQSGVLAVTSGEDIAWISLCEGRVVRSRALGSDESSRDTLMRVLSWTTAQFELTAGDDDGADEVRMSTTALLLEHARRQDERARAAGEDPGSGGNSGSACGDREDPALTRTLRN